MDDGEAPMRKMMRSAAVALFALGTAAGAAAQGLHGDVAAGYAWMDEGGSLSSFRTQYNLGEASFLETLTLEWARPSGGPPVFSLKAWDLGDPAPDHHGRLLFQPTAAWRFEVAYDGRNSFYGLQDSPVNPRADRWSIERWRASVAYDGWSAARITLAFRQSQRDGDVDRVLYGLNAFYPMRVRLDERFREGSLRIETKTLPVRLFFEQSFGNFDRENRWRPLGGRDLSGHDPDLLGQLATTQKDSVDLPSTRLGAFFRNARWDVAATAFYSRSDLDSAGLSSKVFEVGGGTIGQISYLEDLAGSATQDTRAADFRAAFRLEGGWSLRFLGNYRRSDADSDLMGLLLLHAGRPGLPGLTLSLPKDDRGFFNVNDRSAALEAAWDGGAFHAWGGLFAGRRGVDYRRSQDGAAFSQDRNTSGYRLGGAWDAGDRLRLDGEFEHGSFERYVLRVDPETVDRLTLRLRSRLGRSWSLSLQGRFERADNPSSQSGLDHSADAYGARLSWDDPQGKAGAHLAVDRNRIRTRTDLVLPGGAASLSDYDLRLWTLEAGGYVTVGRLSFNGTLLRIKDSGGTWPSSGWVGDGRATLAGPKGTRLSLFAQRRSYDEVRSAAGDFRFTRYGAVIGWRF